MNGAGNDFIIINNIEEQIPEEDFSYLAELLCERHLSIGADGMMFVDKPRGEGDYRMEFFNSDGSRGEMCGNGARCICRFGYENGLTGEIQKVETTAGLVTGRRIDEKRYEVKLNDPSILELECEAETDEGIFTCAYVELGDPGVPHAVLLSDETDENVLRRIGRKLRYSSAFPKGANVNFVELLPDGNAYIRTYERGVEDLTYACGTGTASTAAVLALRKLQEQKDECKADGAQEICTSPAVYSAKFDMKGGTLEIKLDVCEGVVKDIYLTGPTNIVAKGEVTDENLKLQ